MSVTEGLGMNYKIQLYHFHEYARRELKLNVAWNNIIKCRRDEDLVDAKKNSEQYKNGTGSTFSYCECRYHSKGQQGDKS